MLTSGLLRKNRIKLKKLESSPQLHGAYSRKDKRRGRTHALFMNSRRSRISQLKGNCTEPWQTYTCAQTTMRCARSRWKRHSNFARMIQPYVLVPVTLTRKLESEP